MNEGPSHSQPPETAGSSSSDSRRALLWRPRRGDTSGTIEQYSKFVAIMKIALPVSAAVLLLVVIFLPLIREHEDRFRIGSGAEKEGSANTLSMTNARYYGTDDKGEPYTVTARNVRQTGSNDRVIDLTSPNAEITMKDGTWLSASADSGELDRDKHILDLAGHVSVYQYQGNELHTSSARVLLKEGAASGSDPVSGFGSFGHLEAAKGFDYSRDDKRIHFRGPVHLVINRDHGKGESDSSAPAPATGTQR